MDVPRLKLPKYLNPVFISWVALANVGAIILGLIWYFTSPGTFGNKPGLSLGLILGINILSLFMLVPLFKMDPIKPFLIPAIIWFIVVAVVYILLGLYYFLILAAVQLAADLWYHWELNRITIE